MNLRRNLRIWFALACLVSACNDEPTEAGNSPGLVVTLSECGKETSKRSAEPKQGVLDFASPDSISFRIPVTLSCAAAYAFKASLISPDTLSLEARDLSVEPSTCFCEQGMTVHLKAGKGEDFSQVRAVRMDSASFGLSPAIP